MYFKKLELIGFKSFAEKTSVEFEPGVTAIVGPNGCGKSNIADAMRWVLGEQSAKSLRGSEMQDVIFNGSVDREPVNFAEVSLILSNESKILPIDYEEVTITRRLYRSGESEYLLNKNPVRLKDIQELLMGTGIGTESYSIIEQGKMDLVLSSKPEDRRLIFEEAAGITKFKSKKKEALRKLEQTSENLLRINDIIQEVKRQIGSIERQAKKAEQYKSEFEKLKNMELAVASNEFLIFERQKKEREENLASLKEEERRVLSTAQAADEKCRAERAHVTEADELLKAATAEEMAASAKISKNQDRILLNRERVGELCERKANLASQMDTARRRIDEFRAEAQRLEAEYAAVRIEEAEGQTVLAKAEADWKAAEEAAQLGTGPSVENELEFRIRAFKDWLIRFGTQNEETLYAEIKNFAKTILGIQASVTDRAMTLRQELLVCLVETRSKQQHAAAKREKMEKDRSWILTSLSNEEARLVALEKEIVEVGAKKDTLEGENALLEKELAELGARRDETVRLSERMRRERDEISRSLEALENERSERHAFLESAREKVHAFELEHAELRFEIDRLKERIFNAYQADLERFAAGFEMSPDQELEKAKIEIQAQREKLSRLGSVNLAALEEYDEVRERFDFLTRQEQDLLKAKDDLEKTISKINRTTRELFTETFEKVRKHFMEYYRLLFGGGAADLVFIDEADVLESGIEIVARPPGKKLQGIALLSGGEKAMTAIALLFALFKVKPSPFCVLDEIDAPLDESNVDRFCGVLREFTVHSQFILITHNKRTMNLAQALYGITMAQTGVSSVVSVRFSENSKLALAQDKDKQEALVG